MRQGRDGEQEWLRIEGSIFFGACNWPATVAATQLGTLSNDDARHINFIDYAGVAMLHQEARRLRHQQRLLVVHHARPQVIADIYKLEGREHCPVQFA